MTIVSEIESLLPKAAPMLAGVVKRLIPLLPLGDDAKVKLADAVDQAVAMEQAGAAIAADIEAILSGATPAA